jgi:hypothetical protein
VVDAFMNPPADTALDAMGAASAGDASLKASIVGMQHDADASILARLHGAHEELGAHKAAQDGAARRGHGGGRQGGRRPRRPPQPAERALALEHRRLVVPSLAAPRPVVR